MKEARFNGLFDSQFKQYHRFVIKAKIPYRYIFEKKIVMGIWILSVYSVKETMVTSHENVCTSVCTKNGYTMRI